MTEAGWTSGKCVESVWTSLGNGHGITQQCGRTGKVQHEGKWYCGIHSPEAKAKRKAKSDVHYQQYREKMDAKYAREDFDRRAGDALRAMNITDPQALTDSYQQGRVAGLREAVFHAQLVMEQLKELRGVPEHLRDTFWHGPAALKALIYELEVLLAQQAQEGGVGE